MSERAAPAGRARRVDVWVRTIRFPETLREPLQQLAKAHRRSLNAEMVWLLEQAVMEYERRHANSDE